MFNGDKEKISNEIETLIGEQCSITGSIKGDGLIKIDGIIEGDITWSDDVILGITSHCKGNITCKSTFISGEINGNVFCEDSLTIESSGVVDGDVSVKTLIVKQGGMLHGKCSMNSENLCK